MAGKKRDQLTEFNRGNILNAARMLFETNGLAETTMDDIAKKADYSKSTIYMYFRSKDEIYNCILLESMVMLRDRLGSAIAEGSDFEETYFAVCRGLSDFQREYPLYFNGLLGEISVDDEDFEKFPVLRDIYNVGEEINELVSLLITRGMRSGYLRPDLEPIPTIFSLWSSLCGIIRMAEQKEKYFRDKLKLSRQAFLDYSFRMLLNAMKAGDKQ